MCIRDSFLEVVGNGGSVAPTYDLRINAFGGSAPTDPLADFAEANGGNNSLGKAYQLGGATALTLLGGLHNLSFNAADLQGTTAGGDWFRVDAARTTQANANQVSIVDTASHAGDLDLRVFDVNGNLLNESITRGSSAETVSFAQQPFDIYVQVFSTSGVVTPNYTLSILNVPASSTEGGPGNDVLVDTSAGGATLRGRGGDDSLDGGVGVDTAAYDGARSASTLVRTGSGWTVSSVAEGMDTLVNIERLGFSDVSVALDLSGNAGTVAKTLGAVFGASAVLNPTFVGVGLHFVDSGMSADNFMQLAINARLGAGASNQAVVDLLFTNIVGFAPSAEQSAGLVSLLNSNTYSVGALGVIAADLSLNTSRIDLVGLEQRGLEFMPYLA